MEINLNSEELKYCCGLVEGYVYNGKLAYEMDLGYGNNKWHIVSSGKDPYYRDFLQTVIETINISNPVKVGFHTIIDDIGFFRVHDMIKDIVYPYDMSLVSITGAKEKAISYVLKQLRADNG